MKREHGRAIVTILLAGAGPFACECTDRRYHDDADPTGSTGLATTGSSAMTTGEGVTAGSTEEAVDASRFIGTFHNENDFVPFGREVYDPGSASIANLEIRADGTAHMSYEICSEQYEPREIAWRWEVHPGPWLELFPGPGEGSLRFMAVDELESLRVMPVGDCDLHFEVDGELVPYETFRPGLACWVNRCEPTGTVHIDYCDGEEPPPCE